MTGDAQFGILLWMMQGCTLALDTRKYITKWELDADVILLGVLSLKTASKIVLFQVTLKNKKPTEFLLWGRLVWNSLVEKAEMYTCLVYSQALFQQGHGGENESLGFSLYQSVKKFLPK